MHHSELKIGKLEIVKFLEIAKSQGLSDGLIKEGMNHQGFSLIHVQSPCVTYNDTYEILKGKPKEGIEPLVWDIPAEHKHGDKSAAHDLLQKRGLPIGIIYKDDTRPSLDKRIENMWSKAKQQTAQQLMDAYEF